MNLKQYNTLPITVTMPSATYSIHIGIEHKYSQPLTSTLSMFPIYINDIEYLINECDILEFELNTVTDTISVTGPAWNDYSFVTIGYEPVEEEE